MFNCNACHKYFISVDRAHIRTRGAGAGWHETEFIFLCRSCHIEQGHLNWKRFTEKHPHLIKILSDKGWHLVEEFGVWKIRKI